MGCCSSSTNEIDLEDKFSSSELSNQVSLTDLRSSILCEDQKKISLTTETNLSNPRLRSTSFSGGFHLVQGEGNSSLSSLNLNPRVVNSKAEDKSFRGFSNVLYFETYQ